MKRLGLIGVLGLVALTACARIDSEERGVIRLELPAAGYLPHASENAVVPSEWLVVVSADDMEKPVVQRVRERSVALPVKPGPNRLVRVLGLIRSTAELVHGYSGDATADVKAGVETVVDITVYPSVLARDPAASLPVYASGKTAPAWSPDVSDVTVAWGTDAVFIRVGFRNAVDAPWNAGDGSVRGILELDVDRNAATGRDSVLLPRMNALAASLGRPVTSAALGVEATIDFTPVDRGYVRLVTAEAVRPLAATFAGNALTVGIPLDLLARMGGSITGGLRMAALTGNKFGHLDFLPDGGVIDTGIAPPPPLEQTAVSGFTGRRIASYYGQGNEPAGVLALRPDGLHVATVSDGGIEYLRTVDGYAFSRTTAPFPLYPMRNGNLNYGTLAFDFDGAGRPVIAYAADDDWGYAYAAIVRGAAAGGFESPVVRHADMGYYYNRSVDVRVVDDRIFAVFPSAMTTAAVDVIENGAFARRALKATSYYQYWGVQFGDRLGANGLPTVYWIDQNTSTFAYEYYRTSLVDSPTRLSFGPTVTAATAAYLESFDQATVGAEDVFLGNDYSNVWFFAPATTLTLATDPNGGGFAPFRPMAPTDFDYINFYAPRMKLSPEGRLAAVWAAEYFKYDPVIGNTSQPYVFYAERLPGATGFSAPIEVGPGRAADIAFDGQGRPILLVVDTAYTGYYGEGIQWDGALRIYRAN